jgi:hypothetical protein
MSLSTCLSPASFPLENKPHSLLQSPCSVPLLPYLSVELHGLRFLLLWLKHQEQNEVDEERVIHPILSHQGLSSKDIRAGAQSRKRNLQSGTEAKALHWLALCDLLILFSYSNQNHLSRGHTSHISSNLNHQSRKCSVSFPTGQSCGSVFLIESPSSWVTLVCQVDITKPSYFLSFTILAFKGWFSGWYTHLRVYSTLSTFTSLWKTNLCSL